MIWEERSPEVEALALRLIRCISAVSNELRWEHAFLVAQDVVRCREAARARVAAREAKELAEFEPMMLLPEDHLRSPKS